MRFTLFLATSVFAALLPRMAGAQAPDCRVLLDAANTAQHPEEIVVAPSTSTTLEVHCNGTGQPTYRWSTGQTSFSITVPAPSAAGSSQGYSVEVTQGGATRTLTALVRTAAPGAPVCSLTRVPAGDVPAFTIVRITASCTNATTFTWTGGYDLRGQGTSQATHVNIVNAADTIPVDVTAVNENGPGVATGIPIRYVVAPPACRIVADPPGRVPAGATVRLTGECDGSPGIYSWAHGVVGNTVVVNPLATATYTLRATNAAGTSVAAVHTIPVAASGPGLRDYTGHWWGGTIENGWGMTLNQHGQALFGVLYFYDATGEPTWAVMPGGTWNADSTVFTGDLYTPYGAPYTNYDASQLVPGSATGSMTLTFANAGSITASYRLGYSQFDPRGRSLTTFGQKNLIPLILNEGRSPGGLAVADMWWGGAAQNGWGISINQRGSELFAAWFTYGADRRPTWFIVSGNNWSLNTFLGQVFRVTGSAWLGVPYDPSQVRTTTAGAANITFAGGSQGTFEYSILATGSATKPIERQQF